MDTTDEIPLEDHRFFTVRLNHLESRHPAALLHLMGNGKLTDHLRQTTSRALQTLGDLVMNKNLPIDQAEEVVLNQIVADPREQSSLDDPKRRRMLKAFLDRYRAALPKFPRTYLSQSETTE
jgi:hypothetical protein